MELSRSNFSKCGGGHLLSRKMLSRKTTLVSNYFSFSLPKYMFEYMFQKNCLVA